MSNPTATPTATPTNNQPTITRPPRPPMPNINGVQRANVAPSNAPPTKPKQDIPGARSNDIAAPARWSDFDDNITPEMCNPPLTLTIRSFVVEQVHQPDNKNKPMPRILFAETRLGLLANKTTRRAIRKAFGDVQQNAVGKKITLRAGVTSGKETVLVSIASERLSHPLPSEAEVFGDVDTPLETAE